MVFPPSAGLRPKPSSPHSWSLDQGCPHCPSILTAGSLGNLGLLSIPVWPIILCRSTRDLRLGAPNHTYYLISRTVIGRRNYVFVIITPLGGNLPVVSARVTHPCATIPNRTVRLACVCARIAFILGQNQTLHLVDGKFTIQRPFSNPPLRKPSKRSRGQTSQ